MENELKNIIKEALKNIGIDVENISLEHPDDLSHGDYSTNVAMMYAKKLGKNPRELAENIVSEILKDKPNIIEKVELAGPGFINFYLSQEFFTESVKEILKQDKNFGKNNIGNNKKVIVEYSSPNIAKPFTVGHLRSTIIGDSVAKILNFSGYDVVRDNHLGDWGTQFGKLIVAIKKWGDLEGLLGDPNPIKALVELYVKFHDEAEKNPELEDEARAWFTKLEKKDEEATNIWKKCVSLSMKEFDRIYGRLRVSDFDTIHGESFFEDKMSAVVEDVKKLGVARESEGAFLIFFEDEKKLPPLMLLKKDGSSLYALRDLATDRFRKGQYGDDIIVINEVGAEQSQYFKQIFEAEEMLGYFKKNQRVHVAHGLYRFAEGKMSTRKGNVIWLADILDELESKVKEKILENKDSEDLDQETIEKIAIAAIKFNDLKRETMQDIIFSWDDMLNIKGDSGPYIQYSCARACSVALKSGKENMEITEVKNWQTTDLEKIMYRFPEIIKRSAKEYEPHYIATYLIELARAFNTFYGNTKIIDGDENEIIYKVAITKAFSVVARNGLNLLGISVPEKM